MVVAGEGWVVQAPMTDAAPRSMVETLWLCPC